MGLSPVLPPIINAITVASFSILTFLLFLLCRQKLQLSKILLLNSSLYIGYLLSLFYTLNFSYATKHLITALSLVVLPLAFYFLGLSKVKLEKELKELFIKTFWIASVLYALIISVTFFTFSNPRYPFKDANFFRKASETIPLISQHPIYSSLILGLAILIGLEYLIRANKSFKVLGVVIGQVIMITMVVLLMSRSVILGLLIGSVIILFKKLKQIKALYLVILTLLSLFIFIKIVPQQNNRFYQLFRKESFKNIDENNSASIRAAIYNCAWINIKKAPMLGYGIGDVKDKLISCYSEKKQFMVKNRYNSHNQYLSIWLGIGLIGLLVFLYMLIYNLRLLYFTSEYLGLSVLLLFITIMFFENILERQTGVILFAFILNLFSYPKWKLLKGEDKK